MNKATEKKWNEDLKYKKHAPTTDWEHPHKKQNHKGWEKQEEKVKIIMQANYNTDGVKENPKRYEGKQHLLKHNEESKKKL